MKSELIRYNSCICVCDTDVLLLKLGLFSTKMGYKGTFKTLNDCSMDVNLIVQKSHIKKIASTVTVFCVICVIIVVVVTCSGQS